MTERPRRRARRRSAGGPGLAATPGLFHGVAGGVRCRPCPGRRSPRAASRRAPGGSPRSAPRGSPGAAPRLPGPPCRACARCPASPYRAARVRPPPAARRRSGARAPAPAARAGPPRPSRAGLLGAAGGERGAERVRERGIPAHQFLPGELLAEPLALLGQLHALGRERDHVGLAVDFDLALQLLVEFGSHSGPLACKPMHAVDGNSKPPRHTAAGPAGGFSSYLMIPSALSASTTCGRVWKACT